MQFVILAAVIAFTVGLVSVLLARKIYISAKKADARLDANKIIKEAEERMEELLAERKEICENSIKQVRRRSEKELQKIQASTEKIKKSIEKREAVHQERLDKRYDRYSREMSAHKKSAEKVKFKRRKVDQRIEKVEKTRQNMVDRLLDKTNQSKEDVLANIQKDLINRANIDSQKIYKEWEEESQVNAERQAREILHVTLSRFARAYSPDRGLGYITFTKPEMAQRLLGPEKRYLKHIETICGVDLIYDERNMTLSVSGFDPVRRELARASMEKMIHDKGLDEKRIETLIAKTKKELFKKIRNNGEKFAKELGIQKISAEIKNTMGALMYRYSFSQNQFFHCTEVGYLCGLLSSELSLPIFDGRRAGGLHDLGKAMDHSIEGGHAVIGADFIQKHGEKDHIVHAVRAHHFDETPSSELAYLVIAADAISGARPGARRSTANTYIQKMEDLELAASSFKEVTDTLILSAGREVRVHVDGNRVKDLDAMKLSKKIADKIEKECSYPGTIKVTVVRKTQAIEFAK